ncbi:vacuolar protein 8 isoform X1 [Iris pallida]|uniref:Vacuolar protein 8 isoform X1 n=1 Tax=Iris pallida TaxID=29817 RepID=A0AAX6GM15_IRIPA|nr:vacuolar protein 8 isoform X1 [Iris pallida]
MVEQGAIAVLAKLLRSKGRRTRFKPWISWPRWPSRTIASSRGSSEKGRRDARRHPAAGLARLVEGERGCSSSNRDVLLHVGQLSEHSNRLRFSRPALVLLRYGEVSVRDRLSGRRRGCVWCRRRPGRRWAISGSCPSS